MQLSRRGLLGSAAALSTVPVLRARAQAKPVIKLGVLTDLSGTYRDNTGPTSVAAAQLAITIRALLSRRIVSSSENCLQLRQSHRFHQPDLNAPILPVASSILRRISDHVLIV